MPSVTDVEVTHRASTHRPPPQVHCQFDQSEGSEPELEDIQQAIEQNGVTGVALTAVDDKSMWPASRGACRIAATEADLVARVWQHPLVPIVERTLACEDGIQDWVISWDPAEGQLSTDPGGIAWEETAPLKVRVTIGPASNSDLVHQVDQAVTEAVVSQQPRTSNAYVAVSGSDQEQAQLNTGAGFTAETVDLEIGFAPRGVKAHDCTRVAGTDARRIGEAAREVYGKIRSPQSAHPTQTATEPIQLTITSPPYVDVINYDEYGGDGSWSRETETRDTDVVDDWVQEQRDIFQSVFDATAEGGYCAVVIGEVKIETGHRLRLPDILDDVLQDIGWQFAESIVWDKTTEGESAAEFQTTAAYPYPTYVYPNQRTERILIYRKGDIVHRMPEHDRLELTELMTREWGNDIWHIPPVPMNRKDIDHPAPFPEEIVHRLVLSYTARGDIVADPFAGSGTTLTVADRLGRIGAGTELEPAFVETARKRVATAEYTRRDQLVVNFERQETGVTDELAHIDEAPVSHVRDRGELSDDGGNSAEEATPNSNDNTEDDNDGMGSVSSTHSLADFSK